MLARLTILGIHIVYIAGTSAGVEPKKYMHPSSQAGKGRTQAQPIWEMPVHSYLDWM